MIIDYRDVGSPVATLFITCLCFGDASEGFGGIR
jgi:hypothetical protein